MRAVLARVGVITTSSTDYAQKYGLTLSTRVPLEIAQAPGNLLPASDATSTETSNWADLTAEQEAQLWTQAESLFEQLKQPPEERRVMWIPDISPNTVLLTGAVAAAVSVSPVQAANNYVLGVCETATQSLGTEIYPKYDGDAYLYNLSLKFQVQHLE